VSRPGAADGDWAPAAPGRAGEEAPRQPAAPPEAGPAAAAPAAAHGGSAGGDASPSPAAAAAAAVPDAAAGGAPAAAAAGAPRAPAAGEPAALERVLGAAAFLLPLSEGVFRVALLTLQNARDNCYELTWCAGVTEGGPAAAAGSGAGWARAGRGRDSWFSRGRPHWRAWGCH
jgi:hypothetical protein